MPVLPPATSPPCFNHAFNVASYTSVAKLPATGKLFQSPLRGVQNGLSMLTSPLPPTLRVLGLLTLCPNLMMTVALSTRPAHIGGAPTEYEVPARFVTPA